MANVKSDIKLLDDFDGQVKAEAPDFCIDGGAGRRKNNSPYRRAFVHDYDDGLTVNWVNDYSGGVTINGVKKIEGHNSGPIKKTEFSDTVDFKGGVDYYSQIRIIATAVFYTRLYMDPEHNLVIENKPMLGMPSKQTIFKTPVHFERPVKLSGILQPGSRTIAGVVTEIPDLLLEIIKLKNEIFSLKEKVNKLEQTVS